MNYRDRTCLVVGVGLTGLVAATILEREGLQVTVLDKGRGIGGRLATRCIRDHALGESVFDYGAQFFTVRDPRFRTWVDQSRRATPTLQVGREPVGNYLVGVWVMRYTLIADAKAW